MNADERTGGRVRKLDLLRIVLRSFTLQASWNYRRMQNLGFLFSVLPGLRRIHRNDEALRESAVRHLEFFNAQPYLSSYALGTTLRLEEELYATAPPGDARDVSRWKKSLSSSLGSVGDSLFWRGFRPACGIVGVSLSLCIGWIAPVIYLIIFNTLHIFVRVRGVFTGYARGREAMDDLKGSLYRRFPSWFEGVVCFVAGGLLVALMWGATELPGIESGWIVYPVLVAAFHGFLGLFTSRSLLYTTSVVLALGVLLWEFLGGY